MEPYVLMTPLSYPGAAVLALMGTEPPRLSNGIAKWNEITRPRRRNAIEFVSENLLKLKLDIMLNAWPDGEVEGLVRQIYGWAARINLPTQPTLIQLAGPVPYTQLQWVITAIDDSGLVERRDSDGLRCRQQLLIEFTEYQAPDLIVQQPSPAAAAQATTAASTSAAPAASNPVTYTVKKGDTLSSIAARLLGNANKWQSIASLNGVRDPKKLQIGQVLKMPS